MSTPVFTQLMLQGFVCLVVLRLSDLTTSAKIILLVHFVSIISLHTFLVIVRLVRNIWYCCEGRGCLGGSNILYVMQDRSSLSSPTISSIAKLSSDICFVDWPSNSPSMKLACHWFVHLLDLCPVKTLYWIRLRIRIFSYMYGFALQFNLQRTNIRLIMRICFFWNFQRSLVRKLLIWRNTMLAIQLKFCLISKVNCLWYTPNGVEFQFVLDQIFKSTNISGYLLLRRVIEVDLSI